jgi:hypothetical protein
VASALLVAGAGGAQGDVGDRFARITRRHQEVLAAKGPFVHASLRRLWQEWDQGDPAEVEEALVEIQQNPAVSPPARAYAGLLQAYARRRRGDLDGAQQKIQKLGYVAKWMVIGPFDNEGKAGLDRAFGPEDDKEAPSLARSFDGKERPVHWRVSPATSAYGWLDLGALMRPEENGCGYALTFVKDAKLTGAAARPISVWAGSAGAMRVFWNGKEVLKDDKYRALDSDRFAASVTLHAGYNRLLV